MTLDDLIKEFPEQFFDGCTTCVSDLPDGWGQLVREVMLKVKEHHVPVKWAQIKEKFGGLRMYETQVTQGSLHDLYDWISTAEHKASKTCQQCGNVGKHRKGNVILCCSCEKHRRMN